MALQLRAHDGSTGMNASKNLSLRENADFAQNAKSALPAHLRHPPNSDCASRQSVLRGIRNMFKLSRIAALAIVVFVVSVAGCSIVAQAASRRV